MRRRRWPCVPVDRGIVELIVSIGAVKLGEFTLASGARSSVYVDLREFPMHPREFREAVRRMASRAGELMGSTGAEVIAGVATGGIPWAIGVALELGAPATYVRPEAKGHGTSRRVEARVAGRRVLIVDDVATTGGSLAAAIEALRGAGASVKAALVVVDRLQGARERLAGLGVPLYSLATLRDILEYMAGRGLGDPYLLERALAEVGAP